MSKIKPIDTKDPEELREHLNHWNGIAQLSGLELSASEIDEMVRLHCEEGLDLEACVERMMTGGKGALH